VFWDRILEYINKSVEDRITDKQVLEVLGQLHSRELIFRRESSAFSDSHEHIFKHALLREVTYESVLKRVRQAYHALVAEWLIEHAGEREGEFTGLIADHLEQAGKENEAYWYLIRAGRGAAAKYANEEVIRFFNRALELLMTQPNTLERAKQELDILMSLGSALIASRGIGSPIVGRTYTRARELAIQTEQLEKIFYATWGQWNFYDHNCDFDTARMLIDQLFDLAEQSGDENLLLEAYHSAYATEHATGNMLASDNYVKNLLEIYRPELHQDHSQLTGHDPAVCAMSNGAVILWIHGYPDQAKERALNGLGLSARLENPFSSALAKWGESCVAFFSGEFAEAAKKTQKLFAFSEEQGLQLTINVALLLLGAALAKRGNRVDGMTKIKKGLKLAKFNNSFVVIPFALSLYLEACLENGSIEDGLNMVERELVNHPITGERWMESEIRRLYGELILANDPGRVAEAEAEFNLAFEISQRQHAKSLELRAMMSLARLWQQQGKIKQAHARLNEVYNWFTEGFDTQDLKEAKALLEELEG